MSETAIKKNQTAEIPTKSGSKYSYQYVDIAQIHEYLEQNNMRYIQYIKRIDNEDYIFTKRYIDGAWETEALQGCKVVDATLYGNDNPAQKQGSAITYARRYSLLMAFGLATEDDDANSLNKNQKPYNKPDPKQSQPKLESMTLEEAKNIKIAFGKYAGNTLSEIMEKDLQYCDYLMANSKDENILLALQTILNHSVNM